jgi:hypothetical protein
MKDISMKINFYTSQSDDPQIFDVESAGTVGDCFVGLDQSVREMILDSSGVRRFVSVYLGVPGQGVRNVKTEQGLETAIKSGEELTVLIADPFKD